jgi:rod shape determining protein RodA
MWDYRAISRVDIRLFPIVFCLMAIGLCVISSMTGMDAETEVFWTPVAKSQLRWYCLGWVVFFFAAGFDYRKLRDWSLVLYIGMIVLLVGLFFVSPIQNVHRWYRIPGLMSLQPSEQSKLIIVIVVSWFLERKGNPRGTSCRYPVPPYFEAARFRNRVDPLSDRSWYGLFCRNE